MAISKNPHVVRYMAPRTDALYFEHFICKLCKTQFARQIVTLGVPTRPPQAVPALNAEETARARMLARWVYD